MTAVPQLHTRRLSLRPLTADDLAQFHATNTEPYVRRYLWDDEVIPLTVARDLLQQSTQLFRDEHRGLWKIVERANSQYLGYAGLWTFFAEDQPQLLYALEQQHTGSGYATEAASAIVDYALFRLGFNYLVASMDSANIESVKLCERIGLKRVEERVIEGKPTSFYRIDSTH